MDPLAHTLFGAALAEAGLKHRTRYATATLLIGANLPDIDAIATFWGEDFSLFARRGHTHGILAMLVLPLLLAGAVLLWHRWRQARGAAGGSATPGSAPGARLAAAHGPGVLAPPPVNVRALLALSFLAVLSHPLLDWLNTYGVRLLMPFDDRWFYGDTLFIVEPWAWVLAAAGVVLARSATRRAIAGWLVVAALTTGLVLSTDLVPGLVKVLWCVALAVLVALRARQPRWASSTRVARAALLVLFLYVGAAFALARLAESALAARYPQALRVQANPPPAIPLAHRMVVEEPGLYRVVASQGPVHEVPRVPANAIVQAALASPSIRGFTTWMRFPDWQVEDAGDHWRVRIRDLRYQGPDLPATPGIGLVEVDVPKDHAAAP
jgi:inner membrane protein